MTDYGDTAERILAHFDKAEYEVAGAMISDLTGTPRLISDPIAITLGIKDVRDNLSDLLRVLFACYGFRKVFEG